jgi:hypothetical protein
MTISKTLIPKASQKEVTVELLFIGDEMLNGFQVRSQVPEVL